MKDMAHLSVPIDSWHKIFWGLCLALGALAPVFAPMLPTLTQHLQWVVDTSYYLYLLIPLVVTLLAVREAWHYLTRS